MSTKADHALLACAVLLLATACTSTEAGLAGADPSAAPAAPELPRRPAELSLRGVDPCRLLSDAQLDELKVTSEPRLATEQRDGPTCSLDVDRTEPYYSYYVETITTADVRAWLDGERANPSTNTEPAEVEGFPALVNHAPGPHPGDCETLVGVAEGQTLRTQLYPVTQNAFDQRQLCDMSTQAARLAVQTLQATR
ncbi:DUF3558 domain-containing protein [Qaidamihabitans albus]|uniref:DUF3558 domain-containing protein n=1 Tax=Qaidamihabitans albus TaxID=2795733 RepID=UPI0018F12D96|nr:DUF3558 domain-containing protein [Qaidamihabitans albus]